MLFMLVGPAVAIAEPGIAIGAGVARSGPTAAAPEAELSWEIWPKQYI